MTNIELIDSHCHLIFENFEEDLEEVVSRWRSIAVSYTHLTLPTNREV